jgi:hypothetical protein
MKDTMLIAGKALDEWAQEWHPVEGGLYTQEPELSFLVGVYRLVLDGTVVYLGRATEFANGGFTKRFHDFTRKGAGGRSHYAGKLAYEHRRKLEVEVIVTGIDHTAAWTAKRLKQAFLAKQRPPWNVPAAHR